MAKFEAVCLHLRCHKPKYISSVIWAVPQRTFQTSSRRWSPNSSPHDELPEEAPFKVDLTTKTVTTAVGSLPLSPLMDPSFHEARQRFTRPKDPESSTAEKTKFRRLLERNPYALALATPPRKCTSTKAILPSFFLNQFRLVAHPTTDEPWFVPQGLEPHQKPNPPPPVPEAKPADEPGPPTTPTKPPKPPTGQSGWLLSRGDLYRALFDPASPLKQSHRQLLRQGTHGSRGIDRSLNRAIFREDMGAFLLTTMRRRVVDDLLFYAGLVENQGRKYLVRCASWDEVQRLKHRGCVLVLDPEALLGEIPRLSTMDVEGARFGGRLGVHDLRSLLGEDELGRLRAGSAVLREGGLFLLGRKRTMDLQLLLWKLQGFLAFGEPERDVPGG